MKTVLSEGPKSWDSKTYKPWDLSTELRNEMEGRESKTVCRSQSEKATGGGGAAPKMPKTQTLAKLLRLRESKIVK